MKYSLTEDLTKNDLFLFRGGGETRIQAIGSGTAQIMGKVTKEGESGVLSLVNLSTYEVTDTISDNAVYAVDTTGLYTVSAVNNGFTNINIRVIEECG
jgi:hypothetical protein